MNKASGIELRRVSKTYGKNSPVIENLDLQVKQGSFTILLGPSGCGKSTILRMIAGLEKETAGDIFLDGKNMRGVGPGDRQIAMVFQNYALYPTMTVKGNIEFGLKNMKVPKHEREARIAEIVEKVGLSEYLHRKPQHLSGGQRQRVALARAIVKKPKVFLMDEPLSNLDAKLRAQIRTDLIELHRNLGTTFVYVTHDQVEAMSMASDIVLLEQGKIRQQDAPESIYSSPRNLFTARFIGSPPMNVVNVDRVPRDCASSLPAGTAVLGFRPEKTVVHDNEGGQKNDSDFNLDLNSEFNPDFNNDSDHIFLRGELVAREMLGDHTLYKLKTEGGYIHAKSTGGAVVEYGRRTISVDKKFLYCFDAKGDRVV
ncbi:MAG: ABC transporter ATP-binding protein [Synergistaceae bacterium]|jgi:sn-glycerol 3-phosphate transport system ATP-binding protein|nr:ABC transporter ATP-binding protein [Synergistaceae bacterium]